MTLFRLRLALLTLLAALFSMGEEACADGFPAVIRIGTPALTNADGKVRASTTAGPALTDAIAQEFAGTDTRIEWVYFVNVGPGINEAFAAQQIDFAGYGDFPAVIAKSGGIDIKLLVPSSRGTLESYLVVPKDSPATSIADLRGKRLAVNFGRPWMIALEHLIDSAGLKKNDFQIFNLVMPDGDAAVAAGNVDAQYTLDGLQLQSRGLAKIIWSTRDAPLDWKFTADLFGRQDFVTRYPEATRRLVRAYLRAAGYNADHPDGYIENLSNSQNIPLDLLKDEWRSKDVANALSPLFDDYELRHYQQVIDYAFDNKLIRRKFDAAELFDPHFVAAELPSLGLDHRWQPGADLAPAKSAARREPS